MTNKIIEPKTDTDVTTNTASADNVEFYTHVFKGHPFFVYEINNKIHLMKDDIIKMCESSGIVRITLKTHESETFTINYGKDRFYEMDFLTQDAVYKLIYNDNKTHIIVKDQDKKLLSELMDDLKNIKIVKINKLVKLLESRNQKNNNSTKLHINYY
jgi:hypothetical protein